MLQFFPLAFKNIFRNRKRSVTLGVNYAVVTLILVLLFAFSAGATQNIETNLMRSSAGHITISGQYAKGGRIYPGIPDTKEIVDIARNTLGSVEAVPRYVLMSTLYFKGLSKRLTFVGFDTATDNGFEDQLNFLGGSWQAFLNDPNGIIVPEDTATYYGLTTGDQTTISTRSRLGAFNTGIMKVDGIYTSNNYFAKGFVLAHYDFLQKLDLAGSDSSSQLFLYLTDTSRLNYKRDLLMEAYRSAGFEVSKPTSDTEALEIVTSASTKYQVDKANRDRVMLRIATIGEVLGIVRTVLAAVNAVGSVIAAIMLFIIAVSILINLRMTINERLREIGTMRAIGFETTGVTALFVSENVILSLIFIGIGIIAALLVTGIFAYLVVLPSTGNLGLFLDRGHLVLIPTVAGVLGVAAVITLFTALFSYFPARRGGRITPVEALNRVF
ncbi:MAG TPA: FtsX-like permease family protein [Spirochaetia bacterium]|nr:FtsX-like permease family protein [Spirochaetia bacterium]